jgi:regulator of protease activity HflC (stomatin/prohibitin superfamily)
MAEITNLGFVRHLRSDASAYVLRWKGGRLVAEGRGLSFLFAPHVASVAEVPVDDREMPILFHGRSADFQDVTAQGVLTYRVVDPKVLAARVDFTVDLAGGGYRRQPLESLALLFSQLAEQHAAGWVARTPVREVLADGPERIRAAIAAGLAVDPAPAAMGLEVVSIRVSSVRPTPEVEKALEAPTRERIQQAADEAAFARRALAVEKERAIQENELQNRIELARREEELIGQQGQNGRRQAEEEAEAARVAAEAKAARGAIEAEAEAARARAAADAAAHGVRTAGEAEAQRTRAQGEADAASLELSEKVRVAAERARMEAYREVPPAVLYGLAAQALAGKLERIERVSLGDAALGPALERILDAGAKRLGGE